MPKSLYGQKNDYQINAIHEKQSTKQYLLLWVCPSNIRPKLKGGKSNTNINYPIIYGTNNSEIKFKQRNFYKQHKVDMQDNNKIIGAEFASVKHQNWIVPGTENEITT